MMGVFVVLLAATGIMRLGEVVVSVRRMRERPGDVVDEPWLFPLMVVLHFGLVLLPLAEVMLLDRPFSWAVGGPALAIGVGATVLRVWTLRTIGYSWNVRVVTPPADGIATTGPYAWIRHPNYLVVILEIVALPLVHSAWMSSVSLTALNALVLWHRIRNEEAVLMRNPVWRRAFEDKPRLFPGL